MIKVTRLSKRFRLYKKPSDRLIEILTRKSRHHSYAALQEISFELPKGQTLGILGRNGAGKSTLLKILNGVLIPDSGHVETEGKITGLLELGTGFDYELTGLQNIYGNGLLIGMTAEEIEERKADIIAFSELGEYIHEPVRTYSSGMTMRLAFAIAIHADPTCFLVDEALSVGDGHFQQKCIRRIKEFRAAGGSIIFVSHDLNAVKMICDRTLVLHDGEVVFDGAPEDGVNRYNQILAALDSAELSTYSAQKTESYGTYEAKLGAVSLIGENSRATTLSSGEKALIDIEIVGQKPVKDLTVGILIRDRFGQDIFGTNTHLMQQPLAVDANQHLRVRFALPMDIAAGKYTLTVALHSDDNHLGECYDWRDNIVRFEIAGVIGQPFGGVCRLRPELEITKETRKISHE